MNLWYVIAVFNCNLLHLLKICQAPLLSLTIFCCFYFRTWVKRFTFLHFSLLVLWKVFTLFHLILVLLYSASTLILHDFAGHLCFFFLWLLSLALHFIWISKPRSSCTSYYRTTSIKYFEHGCFSYSSNMIYSSQPHNFICVL